MRFYVIPHAKWQKVDIWKYKAKIGKGIKYLL